MSTPVNYKSDLLINRNLVSVLNARKICNSVGFVGPALGLLALAYSGCNYVASAVFLCLAIGFNGAVYSGFQVRKTLIIFLGLGYVYNGIRTSLWYYSARF